MNVSKRSTSIWLISSICYYNLFIQTDLIQVYIWLKWSISNGSLPSGNKPSNYLIILHFWRGWGCFKTRQRCIYLTVLFLYRIHQYAIIMSSSSSESSMTSVLQTGFAWKRFSKVIKIRTVLGPVYVVLWIHRDPDNERDNQISQYLHSMYRTTCVI